MEGKQLVGKHPQRKCNMKFRAYTFVAVLLVATLAPYTIAQNPPEAQNPNSTAAPAVTGTPQTADSRTAD